MLQKILLTFIFITIVWFGFKWFDRMRGLKAAKANKKVNHNFNMHEQNQINDMVQCTKCGAYVPDDGQHKCR